ncbi:MAG: DUF4124 domain-containing protein [Gammaproteobacteria bacterium]|nr:DUF4124 domain-containing protein [Gammaproteobacteria bacterium]
MMTKHKLIYLGAVCVLLAGSATAGGIKKWVDENGLVHYGTSIPPQYLDKAHSELNDRGIEIRRRERSMTPEEIQREKALAALRAEQERLKEEQHARDRILLSLYRNEDDLVMARDGKIAQIDAQIRLKHNEIRRLKDRLSEHQASAAAAERSGRRLSERQQENLDSTQRSIERSYAIILGKEDEKRVTIEKYDYDLNRFRALRQHAARSQNADIIKESDIPDLVETAVHCADSQHCGRMWQIAQSYAKKHATTPIDLAADRILVTAPPRELRDISITVSRLADDEGGGERIFMDVQCANFTEGREFCRSDHVEGIRENFRFALNPTGENAKP